MQVLLLLLLQLLHLGQRVHQGLGHGSRSGSWSRLHLLGQHARAGPRSGPGCMLHLPRQLTQVGPGPWDVLLLLLGCAIIFGPGLRLLLLMMGVPPGCSGSSGPRLHQPAVPTRVLAVPRTLGGAEGLPEL